MRFQRLRLSLLPSCRRFRRRPVRARGARSSPLARAMFMKTVSITRLSAERVGRQSGLLQREPAMGRAPTQGSHWPSGLSLLTAVRPAAWTAADHGETYVV